jgi:DNA-binding response OmpR family regulator
MRAARVLLIESARFNGVSFAAALKRRYQVQIAHSGKQGLSMAEESRPDVIVLDAASLRTSGDRICARFRASLGELPIIHICAHDHAKAESPADVLLALPFTPRKLINRIERFVVMPEGELLEAGPFSLNLAKQTLTAPWNEKKLTPKLVALMEAFMRSPNQTLERREIMQKVWNTDYMGDTRTLDVHIRWIRKIVEPNPRKPQYIMTVRGIGYRLALPGAEPEPDPKPPAKAPAKAAESDKSSRNSHVPSPESPADSHEQAKVLDTSS